MQIVVGQISILLTFAVAIGLGFQYSGSLLSLFVIAVLTSISIIPFGLILAAATKKVNGVLIVGNFPLFLFMFFTGVALPIKGQVLFTVLDYLIRRQLTEQSHKSQVLFTVLDYPVTLPGLMSPSHAVSALRKIMIMNMRLEEVLLEITALLVLTIFYFIIGIWAFRKRRMRVE